MILPEQIDLTRVRLLRNVPTDAEEIFYAYASKPEATRFLSWATHEELSDTRNYLRFAKSTWREQTQFSFSVRIKTSNRLIGGCGCIHQDGLFQVGYVFSPSVWGQGYATEVCKGLVTEILKYPGLRRLCSFVDVENQASARVLEKSGFIKEQLATDYFVPVNQGKWKKDAYIFVYPLANKGSEAIK